MPFGIVMSPTIIAALVALVLQGLTLGWGFVQSNRADSYKGKLETCNATHAAFVLQTEAVGRIAAAKAKETEEANRRTADETAKGWAAAIAAVRADYAKRLRDAASRSSGSGAMPGVSQDQPGATEASSDAIPAPARVAADCAETTVTANFLQSYIERLEGLSK